MGNGTAQPKTDINLRKAKAGRLLIEQPDLPLAQALTQADYSPSTARNPKRNKVGASQCIAEAVKADPTIDPSKLLSQARLVLSEKLEYVQGKPEQTKLGELARTIDVVERWYAGHSDSANERQAKDTVDRMEQLAFVLRELERRGRITVNPTPEPGPDDT